MAQNSPSRRRHWRPASAITPRRTLAVANWRRAESSLGQASAQRWRLIKIVVGLLTAAVCYASAVEVALLLSPLQPVGRYIVKAGYLKNLAIPPNAHGLYSAEAFSSLSAFSQSTGWLRSWSGGFGKLLEKDLTESWSDGLGDMPAETIIELTGAAGADEQGAFVYVDVPAEELLHPEDLGQTSKIYIEGVINKLRDLKKQSHRQFLLLLDVTKAAEIVPLGMLQNDFNSKLLELHKLVEESGVFVLAPGTPAGRDLLAPSGAETAFGYSVVAGLSGEAADQNGRVDTEGLYQYLKKQPNLDPIFLGYRFPSLTLALVDPDRPARVAQSATNAQPIPTGSDLWNRYHAIADLGPEADSPHLWRRYRDTLLRVEELGRFGSPTGTGVADLIAKASTELQAELDELGHRIEVDRKISLRSATTSLAMPVVEGMPIPPPSLRRPQFQRFYREVKPELVPPLIGADRQSFYASMVGEVESDPGVIDLDLALIKHNQLGLPFSPAPGEANFLAILIRDRPAGLFDTAPGQALVRQALRVRRLAERVAVGLTELTGDQGSYYPGAEWIAPELRDHVFRGDQVRRIAEDRLFVSDPSVRARAGAELNKAEKHYQHAADLAADLLAAVRSRDRAFADLPYYARWIVDQPATATTSLTVKLVQDAWDAAHDLTQQLKTMTSPVVLSALSLKLSSTLGSIDKAFRAEVEQGRDTGKTASRPTLLALLDTPFLSVEEREALLRRLAKGAPPQPVNPLGVEATTRAAWAGRLAIAALGERWISAEEPIAPTINTIRSQRFAKFRTQFAAIEVTPGATKLRSDALMQLGDEIGRSWRRLPGAIAGRVKSGLEDKLDGPQGDLLDADRLGRLVLGGQSASAGVMRRGKTPFEPTAVLRRRLIQSLLLRQAHRAIDDHWYAPTNLTDRDQGPTPPPPYFRQVVVALLGDLNSLGHELGTTTADIKEVREVADENNRPDRLVIKGPRQPVLVTDEPVFELRFKVEAVSPANQQRDGTPVLWLDLGEVNQIRLAADDYPRQDVPIERASSSTESDFPPTGPRDGVHVGRLTFPVVAQVVAEPDSIRRPIVLTNPFQVAGRYRGQILNQPREVRIHPIPEIKVEQGPPPWTGAVSVRANPKLIGRYGSVGDGALVIVLDCSGSMGPPKNSADNAPSKYREATAAIRQVLCQVTRGTKVSIWAFGEAIWPNRKATPEQTIQQIQPPVSWYPGDAEQLEAVMRRIEPPALLPWNDSPLVQTMIAARVDFEGVSGFKSMVVVTDGLDNCFTVAPAPVGGPKPEIGQALLEAFRGSQVEVNIVGYKIQDSESAIRTQLEVIESFQPPGHFVPVWQADQLGKLLASSLKPTIRYSVQTTNNVVVRGDVERGDGPGWPNFKGLDPGNYKLVAETESRLEFPLTINPGDDLVVRWAQRADGRIAMERVLWTDVAPARPAIRDVRDWRLAGLSQLTPDLGLRLDASLERRRDPGETALQLIRPAQAWMEVVAGANLKAPFQQRWRCVEGGPASTWELLIPTWAEGQEELPAIKPAIRAYWNPYTVEEPKVSVNITEIRSVDEVLNLSVPTARGPVIIDSIRIEPDSSNGDRNLKKLVVRASLPPQNRTDLPDQSPPDADRVSSGGPAHERFWVRPIGLTAASSEHRHYTAAGKYTGVFWPLTEDQIRGSLTALEVISVSEFQSKAINRGFASENFETNIPIRERPDSGPFTERPSIGPSLPSTSPATLAR